MVPTGVLLAAPGVYRVKQKEFIAVQMESNTIMNK